MAGSRQKNNGVRAFEPGEWKAAAKAAMSSSASEQGACAFRAEPGE
jgi:hypothetical protein